MLKRCLGLFLCLFPERPGRRALTRKRAQGCRRSGTCERNLSVKRICFLFVMRLCNLFLPFGEDGDASAQHPRRILPAGPKRRIRHKRCGRRAASIFPHPGVVMIVVLLVCLLVGFLVGLAGVGGILGPPVLILMSGLEPHTAMGTALASFIGTGSTAIVASALHAI